jgi:hypothetical protein
MAAARAVQEKAGLTRDYGLRIEFERFPEIELAVKSPEPDSRGLNFSISVNGMAGFTPPFLSRTASLAILRKKYVLT